MSVNARLALDRFVCFFGNFEIRNVPKSSICPICSVAFWLEQHECSIKIEHASCVFYLNVNHRMDRSKAAHLRGFAQDQIMIDSTTILSHLFAIAVGFVVRGYLSLESA